MDLLVLAKVLWRKLWILIAIPVIAAFAAYLFTLNLVDTYVSTAQIATGFTLNDQIQIFDEKFNPRDAEVKFNNLLNSMNSGLSFNLTSYRLLLHDLDGKVVPFHRPDPKVFSTTEKEIALVKKLVQRKLDNQSPLATSDPEFHMIRKFLEAYHYSFNDLKENIAIDRINNTDFIQIDVTSDKAALSAFTANAFVEEFLKYHQSTKTERTGESVEFLKQVVDNKKAELDTKLENQRSFRSTNHVYSEGESGMKIAQLSDLESQRDLARRNMHRLELTMQRLKDDIKRVGAPVVTNNNQKILDLRNKINRMNERYITTGSSNQKLLDSLNILREELRIQNDYSSRQGASIPQGMTVADLQMKLKDAEIEYEVEKSNLSMVESKIGNLQYSFSGTASKEARLLALQKEVDIATQEYMAAVEKYNLAKNKMMGTNTMRQVLVAVPPINPESSKRMIIIGLAGATSFFLCLFAIVGLELMDTSIRTPDRFKRMVNLPLAGVLNQIDSRNFNIRTYFNQQNGNEETEMFKSLLRKLRHEVESLNSKVILFTSPKKRDGKTFVMFSLAYVLSLLDKRILIIDTNFKNNSLSQLLGRNKGDLKVLDSKKNKLLVSAQQNGESTKTKESNEFDQENSYDLINPTKYKNIYIVGNSGGGHESPAEILSGRDFANLITTLSDSFDYVLLEGAAMNEYSDTKELVRYCDKVMAVFSAKSSISTLDKDAIHYFKSLGKKFGGSVLNRVEPKDYKL
ncbi:MAG TPA: Wzz/FepE/Etk N-terminal domain-containing protein [Chryseosolibacter sp.]